MQVSDNMWNKKEVSDHIVTYIKQFGSVTTLHGLKHIVHSNRHDVEVYVWVLVTALAAGGALAILANNWQRYNTNPTVISLEKNYRVWKIPFPAATLCLINRVNETAAKEVIQRTWGIRENQQKKFKYYMKFIRSVANLTYGNFQDFKEFKNDNSLINIDIAAVTLKVLANLTYSSYIFNPRYKYLKFIETTTEMGICYTYSGVISNYVSLRKVISYDPSKEFVPPYCNFLNSLCYARIEDLPGTIKYYIHSPYEMPDISDAYYLVNPSNERDTTFRFLDTVSSSELRRLTPKQRRCRFMNEPMKEMDSPVYSYNLCRMNCRKKFAMEVCNCVPYFYGKRSGTKICGVKGLACLANYAEQIKTLTYENGKSYNCLCPLTCRTLDFYSDKDSTRKWEYPVSCNIRFRWAIELYSKTRLKRDVLFGVEDLLVSFGGTAAFFLGCSVITFVELFYFFTLRLFWFMVPVYKNWQQRRHEAPLNHR